MAGNAREELRLLLSQASAAHMQSKYESGAKEYPVAEEHGAMADAILANPDVVLSALGFEKFDEDGMSEQWERRKTARA